MFVNVADLPSVLKRALAQIGYRSSNIEINVAESINVSSGGWDGRRAFTIIANLATQEFRASHGSWGGPNPFTSNVVDSHDKSEPLTANVCAITGYQGNGCLATITMHPDNINKLVQAPSVELSTVESLVLFAYCSYNASGKKDLFSRKRISDTVKAATLASLAGKGLVSLNKAGAATPTTQGKNVAQGIKRPSYF